MTEDPAARTSALEEMLTERGVVDAETVERIASYYETQVGPMVGAGVVARSWVDPAFRERLRASPTKALAELGIGGVESEHIVAVENTPRGSQRRRVHVVLVLPVGGPRSAAGLVQVAGVPQPDSPRAAQGPRRTGAHRCRRRSRSRSGTRPPSSATWLCPSGRPAPTRSTRKRSPSW